MQVILSGEQIQQKINRLAYQLLENCYTEDEIFIGGITGNGIQLAQRISKIISENTPIKTHVFEITMNKENPWDSKTQLSLDKNKLKDQFIVLVDDVLNSGKTMQYALIELLQFKTKAIKTLALVDRQHRRFPIKADFVGLSLSTTLEERVNVIMNNDEEKAYLV